MKYLLKWWFICGYVRKVVNVTSACLFDNSSFNSWLHRPSVFFGISIGTQVTCTYITCLSQPIKICSITTRPSSHVLEASIKTPKEILFCKQTGLYILHRKWGLIVRGHVEPLCMFIVTSKTNFMFFKQRLWLFTVMTSVFRTSQHRCLCKHFTIWKITQNIVKNIIGNVASSYQVNLPIEIPNIADNYINSHVFTWRHWASAMLIWIIRWEVFFDWPHIFLIGRLGANRNMSGKLGMKLAINITRNHILHQYEYSTSVHILDINIFTCYQHAHLTSAWFWNPIIYLTSVFLFNINTLIWHRYTYVTSAHLFENSMPIWHQHTFLVSAHLSYNSW